MKHQLLLTFDVEDFVNADAMASLERVLDLLQKFNIKGLFFITGQMSEKLNGFPLISRKLVTHEIGFHSSGHSIRPTIFEYCDIPDYQKAISESIIRETSHIDPLSGKTEGAGGLLSLRKLFPGKKIESYRAPGYCCPPPHLEAMRNLGVNFDFSWNFSPKPVSFKGITFYPRPVYLDCEEDFLMADGENNKWLRLLMRANVYGIAILNFHPHALVCSEHWDQAYHKGNPLKLNQCSSRENKQTELIFAKLTTLLKRIRSAERMGILTTNPELSAAQRSIDPSALNLEVARNMYALWPRNSFGYEPQNIIQQLEVFFNCDHPEERDH
jgi:hypothetical protein